MAINIKNERVCALVRRAAAVTGRPQITVLEEALERYLAELPTGTDHDERLDRVLEGIDRRMTPDVRAALRRDMDDLYDEQGLPA